jgi:hypothetical protein
MTPAEALALIRAQFQRLDALYGRTVFDEWALLSMAAQGTATVLDYTGPRPDRFSGQVTIDTQALRAAGQKKTYEIGDFEFVHDADGAALDAFIRVGPSAYLVCNHTPGTMEDVRRDPRWRLAQAAWFNLAEKFRADPLAE